MIRAIRKRYLARSEGASDDQPFSNAPRAAPTAAPTSASPAYATSASLSSVAGEIVGSHSFDFGETNSPPMKSP